MKSEKKGDKTRKVHLFGVGGIGVSALAKMYLNKGLKVSGSDLTQTSITDNLYNEDITG